MKNLIICLLLSLTMNIFAKVQKPAPKKINSENEAKKICPTVCGKDNWEVGKYTSDKCECKK
ncbi:MAG: hypothetical protein P4L22_00945 [Candidatus Babeliales bacterium]|nr:hypothetical protein [Candidatus Babeliales bacterium]